MKDFLDLENETWQLYEEAVKTLENDFSKIDKIVEYNTAKVMHAFWENKVSSCF